MVSIDKIADNHHDWCDENGWNMRLSPLEHVALISSEIGELANELRCEESDYDIDKIGEEACDIILRTLNFMKVFGLAVEHRLLDKVAYNYENGSKPGRIR